MTKNFLGREASYTFLIGSYSGPQHEYHRFQLGKPMSFIEVTYTNTSEGFQEQK